MKKNICIVTGSRAEYGLFYPLLKRIKAQAGFTLKIIATGMHLAGPCGFTYREIERDRFKISNKVDLRLHSDNEIGIANALGLGVTKFSRVFQHLRPDALILLGDRYETFAAAVAAHIARIPIIHLYGGEVTDGVIDDAFRHAITKMSMLHFVSLPIYRRRVIQMGESPQRVFTVGALGVDNVRETSLLNRRQLERRLNFHFGARTVLVTFHPVTLDNNLAELQFKEVISALDNFTELKIIFTKPNFDTNSQAIARLIDAYVNRNPGKSAVFCSLGRKLYLSVVKHVDAVVGNSSSGIIEVPSFHKPTINIGDRQKGRVLPASVLSVPAQKSVIISVLEKAFSDAFLKKCKSVRNPYGDGLAAERITMILQDKLPQLRGVKKTFYDV